MVMKMTNNQTMMELNLAEAKAKLSQLVDLLLRGEEEYVIVCRRNVPVAELRALPRKRGEPRPFGLARGRLEVPESFFESLPEEELDGFEGR